MELSLLERFAASLGVTLDRSALIAALREAEESHPDGNESAAERLIALAERVGLRIRRMNGDLTHVRDWLRQIGCVAARTEVANQPGWIVLERATSKKFLIDHTSVTRSGEWLDDQELVELLPSTDGELAEWFVAEPTTSLPELGAETTNAADHAVGHGHHPAHFSPFQRLLGLLRVEKRDISAIFVFAIFVGLLSLATPIAVEALVNTVAFGGLIQPLIVLAILLCTFLGFNSVVRAIQTYVVEMIQRRVFVRVAADLAHRLPRVRAESLDGENGSELLNRFFDVVTVQKVLAMLLLDSIGIVLQAAIGMLVLAFYHPALLAFDVFLLGMIVLVVFGFGRGAVATSIQESRAKYAVADWLQQAAGLGTIFRGSGGSELARSRADLLAAQYVRARQTHFRIVMRQVSGALAIQALAATALLGMGGWLVIAGQLTLGQLVAAELIVSAIVNSFAKLGKHLEGYYDLLTSLDKLGHLFDLPVHEAGGVGPGGVEPLAISLRNLSYAYQSGHTVFDSVTCDIRKGECVALVGPPGSGKSTLLQLLAGWREAKGGRIEYDRHDARDLNVAWIREQVVLLTRPEIFSGSVAENVHCHRRGVTQHQIRSAIESVGLLEEVLRLLDGLNAHLAQGGSPLSDSQICRLVLARALCGGPRLILIDGMLDGLSGECADRVLNALMGEGRRWTVLLVTSRPEFLSRCDRTITLAACHAEYESEVH